MITGDQVLIARETCRELGLSDQVLDASIFRTTPASQLAQLARRIETADGFGQVYPEDKFHIVESLQKSGYVVAMTGDGVNDAPALKEADCGIAVSGATDAARAAADIVLLTPGLSVIVEAIRLSRRIFLRMDSYCLYRVVETVRILIFTTLAILWFNQYPVSVVMLVILALINDGSMVTIAYDNTQESPAPLQWNMPRLLMMATVIGMVGVVETILLYDYATLRLQLPLEQVQTLMYLQLAVGGDAHDLLHPGARPVLVCGSRAHDAGCHRRLSVVVNADGLLWLVDGTRGLGLDCVQLALCPGLVRGV